MTRNSWMEDEDGSNIWSKTLLLNPKEDDAWEEPQEKFLEEEDGDDEEEEDIYSELDFDRDGEFDIDDSYDDEDQDEE